MDGLSNGDEILRGTDPEDEDSDDDGLIDGDEVYGRNNTYGYTSDPKKNDTDDDGISDGFEVNNYGTDPLDSDSDNDGLSDGYEFAVNPSETD